MELIGILIVVGIIYYLKNKKEERDSENEFQIQPDFRGTSSEFNSNNENPFIEQSSLGKDPLFVSENYVETDDAEEKNDTSFTVNENPFIDNITSPKCGRVNRTFPRCPISDENIEKTKKKRIGSIKYPINYDSHATYAIYNTYSLYEYDYQGETLLLIQRVQRFNGKLIYSTIEYGYEWLTIYHLFKQKEGNNIDFGRFYNLHLMPEVSFDEANSIMEENMVFDLQLADKLEEQTISDVDWESNMHTVAIVDNLSYEDVDYLVLLNKKDIYNDGSFVDGSINTVATIKKVDYDSDGNVLWIKTLHDNNTVYDEDITQALISYLINHVGSTDWKTIFIENE